VRFLRLALCRRHHTTPASLLSVATEAMELLAVSLGWEGPCSDSNTWLEVWDIGFVVCSPCKHGRQDWILKCLHGGRPLSLH
jgi:hypothetical protein